nr:MAG TPA: hypothetical protein [Caudoviricetes sp.]
MLGDADQERAGGNFKSYIVIYKSSIISLLKGL